MRPELIKTWEDRLRFADRVWERKGLKGGEGAEQTAREGMIAYRNKSDALSGWGGLDEEAIQKVPITFSSMNTMEAQLLARDPQISLYPRTEAAAEAAPIVENIVNHFIVEQRMRRQWRRALKDANLVSGFGIVWHGYTPPLRKYKLDKDGVPDRLIEVYDPAQPDTPWLRRVPPWDVRIDPTASSFHPDEDAAWAARRYLITPQCFRDDPMYARINVEPTAMLDVRATRNHIRRSTDEGPDFPKMIEIWEFYDKVNQILFHLSPGAEGKIVTKGGERGWPDGIPKEGLPFSYLAFNEQADDPFPISYESMIRDQAIELNKLRTMMAELTKRLRRVVLYRSDLLGEGEAERLIEEIGLKEFMEAKGGDMDKIVKEITLGQFPQELMLYEDRIVGTIREILGQSRFQRAQRENVESAEEAARIGHGDDTQVGRNQSAMEEFITDSVRKWYQGFQAVATDDVTIPLMNDNDARTLEQAGASFQTATPDEIRGEFLFRMRLGSSQPANEVREQQEALQMLATAYKLNDPLLSKPQFLLNWLLAYNKSPKRFLLNQKEREATGAGLPEAEDGAAGPGNGVDLIDQNILRPPGGVQ